MKIKITILSFCFLLIISNYLLAQDSTMAYEPVTNTINNWALGVQLGTSYPIFINQSKNFISNDIGFSLGMEGRYKNIFSKFSICFPDSKVNNAFYLNDEWAKNLPLDLMQFLFSLGYKVNMYDQYYLKPMLGLMSLNYRTDERVKDFTEINRETTLNYYGFSIGLASDYYSNSAVIERTSLELVLSIYEPFNSKNKNIFPDKAFNVSFGLLIFTKHY